MQICLFIHDLDKPDIKEWGDQITNGIVRHVFGMYSLNKPGEFEDLVDLQYVSAMSDPTGGKNRHPQPPEAALRHLRRPAAHRHVAAADFGVIFSSRFGQTDKRGTPQYAQEVQQLAEQLTSTAIHF